MDQPPAAPPTTDPADGFVLETGQRLSRSLLWKLQRAFFEQQGIEAWRQGIVPNYVTSNAVIADAYANVVHGFLKDHAPRSGAGATQAEPVHIVELGAGAGRFSFLLLKQLRELSRAPHAPRAPFKYVMTDLSEKNIAFWRSHPALAPFVEEGLLDFARYDAEAPREIRLAISGQALLPGTVDRPMVVIANYFFDGIPNDVFFVGDGRLHESLVSVHSTQEEPQPAGADALPRISLRFKHEPASTRYYQDEAFNRILEEYQRRLAPVAFHFPISALECCRYFRDLSGGRLLLLSADKGYAQEKSLLARDPTRMAVHGSFSIDVNYHAIARYFRDQGGEALHPSSTHSSLLVAAFLLDGKTAALPETRGAFARSIGEFGPDDFYELKRALEKHAPTLAVSEILSALRLSRCDLKTLFNIAPVLSDKIRSASEQEKEDLYRILLRAWDQHYDIGEAYDVPFQLAVLLYEMSYFPEALIFLDRSLAQRGPDPNTLFNIALCHFRLRQLAPALGFADRVLEALPAHQGARGLRIEILARLQT